MQILTLDYGKKQDNQEIMTIFQSLTYYKYVFTHISEVIGITIIGNQIN